MDPVPDPLLLRKSGSAGNRTRDLCICSQKLWPLDHRGGHMLLFTINISTHENSCDLGSVGAGASGTVRRLWIRTVGWRVVVSCACELIITLSVVFSACSEPCVNFQFRFVIKWTHNKWRPVESDRDACFFNGPTYMMFRQSYSRHEGSQGCWQDHSHSSRSFTVLVNL